MEKPTFVNKQQFLLEKEVLLHNLNAKSNKRVTIVLLMMVQHAAQRNNVVYKIVKENLSNVAMIRNVMWQILLPGLNVLMKMENAEDSFPEEKEEHVVQKKMQINYL